MACTITSHHSLSTVSDIFRQDYATTSVIKFSGHLAWSVPLLLVPTLNFNCTGPCGNLITGFGLSTSFPIAPECRFSKNSGLKSTSPEFCFSIIKKRGSVYCIYFWRHEVSARLACMLYITYIVIMPENLSSVATPDILPYILRVGAHTVDQPLRIVVQCDLDIRIST